MSEKLRKFWRYHGDTVRACLYITVSVIIAGVILYAITTTKLREGMVMNKYYLQGYEKCFDKGKCAVERDKWIIAVQNGERKDWWQVSESYFQTVDLGDWVRK